MHPPSITFKRAAAITLITSQLAWSLFAGSPICKNPPKTALAPAAFSTLSKPIVLLEENHRDGLSRYGLARSLPALKRAGYRRIYLERLKSVYQPPLDHYLMDKKSQMPAMLELGLRYISDEKDAKPNQHSMGALVAAARANGWMVRAIYYSQAYQLPDSLYLPVTDSAYAAKIFLDYKKDSVPSAFLVGEAHGKGVFRWLQRLGPATETIVMWNTATPVLSIPAGSRSMLDSLNYRFEQEMYAPLRRLHPDAGFYRVDASALPSDFIWVSDTTAVR